jgi:hypothetical protein
MCNHKTHIGLALAVVLAMAAPPSPAQTTKPGPSLPDDLIYLPPAHSSGHVRVEGANTVPNRGGVDDLPSLYILAPDDIGLTIQEQPVVFWYLSKPMKTPLHFTLMADDPNAKEPMLEVTLDAGTAGIQSIDLTKYPVKLELNVPYQLSLALKPANNQGSKDVFCSAQIKRTVPQHPLLVQMMAMSDPWEKAKLLARSSVFYDALTLLSREIANDEKNGAWHERRASLLQQVGLTEVASFDRSIPTEAHSSAEP